VIDCNDWLELTVRSGGGVEKVVRLDAYRCLINYAATGHEDEGARAAAFVEFLRGEGCGELSQAAALRVAVKCQEMIPGWAEQYAEGVARRERHARDYYRF
jgi:hypothetical protein